MERWWLCVDAAPWLRFRDMNSAEGVLWPMSGVAVDPEAVMHVPFDCTLSSCDAPDTFDGCDGCGACSLDGCEAVLYVPLVTLSIVVMPVVPSMVAMVAMLRLCSRLQRNCMHTSEGMKA